MKIGENFNNNKKSDRDFDLEVLEDRKEVLQYVKGYKATSLPSITEMLIGRTRIFDIQNSTTLAYTTFNYNTTFFEIYLNFKMFKEKNYDFNFLSFVTFHELMHNFFRHFTRTTLEEYRKKNSYLLNILEDVVINEYLINFLKILDKKNYKNINVNYDILEKMFPNKQLNLRKNEIMSVEELIEQFKDEFENPEKTENLFNSIDQEGSGEGQQLDDHGMSSSLSKVVGEENESVGEGEKASGTQMTEEQAKQIAENSEKTNEQIDEMVKSAINEIIESTKMRGSKCSNEEERLFKIITKKDTAFDFIKLKNVIKNAMGQTPLRTYKKIHRHKTFFTGIPLKGKIFIKPKRLIFAIDTSGSVSEKELNAMMSILFNYLRKHPDVVLDVIAWSSSLDNHYRNIKSEKEIVKLKIGSTGGTEIKYLFDCLEEEYPDEKLNVVIITDGYISKEKYNETIVNDLYFGLTANTSSEVKQMYPFAKIVPLKIEW